MYPSYLLPEAENLTESTSIRLLKKIERQEIATPLSTETILTTYVKQGSSGTPILLLHGFDSSVLELRRLLPLLATENETWAVDLLDLALRSVFLGYPLVQRKLKLISTISGKL